MATLTQNQIEALRNKGMDDNTIQTIASKRGMEIPKESFGKKLIKSEIGFGQSLAGGLGGNAPKGSLMRKLTGQSEIDKANESTNQIQTNLITKIKEKQSRGEDTNRLLNALKTMDKEVNFYDILNTSTGGSLDKSGRQVAGEALGVATDIAAFGTYGKVAKGASKAPTVIANTFGKGFKQGAKTGATFGGGFGASQGVARSAQENKSAGEIVGSGLRGGIEGGIGGAVLGGAIGGISGRIAGRAERLAGKEQTHALNLVAPNPTSKVRTEALQKGGVSESGFLKPSKIQPTGKDYDLANAVADVVSPKKTVIGNIKAVDTKIGEISTGVKNYVNKNKVPFNTNQLRTQLNKGQEELKLIFASDSNAKKTYNAVVDTFIEHVGSKDTAGLLQGRKTVDSIPAIKKLLDSQGMAENVKREVVLTIRRMANEYIGNLLPAGNPYKVDMLRLTRMIEALENIAEKNQGMIGKNNLQLFTEKYPAMKWIIGGIGAGIAGGAGIGVGSAVIGSTD